MARPGRRRRRLILAAIVAVVVVVAGVGVWAARGASGYYAYTPGSAPLLTTSATCRARNGGSLSLPDGKPCARLVVGGGRGHPLRGKVLMVDVLVGKANLFQYLARQLGILDFFQRGAQLIPNETVLGNTPAAQFSCQDAQYMQTASQTAPVLALERLGYKVRARDLGAKVFQVNPDTPASTAGLHCGDLIVRVDDTKVDSSEGLTRALSGRRPGQKVRITVERPGPDGKTSTVTVPVTLGRTPAADRGPADQGHDPNAAFLGIAVTNRVDLHPPFPVEVRVGNIGGPSAGLAMTLALLDTLSGGNLTGGHVIAATGTISPTGQVGAIGGVKQKTVAVQRAGAQLFLVPTAGDNYTDAKATARPGLQVDGVSNLTQALRDIERFGGKVPAKLLRHQA